MLWKYFCALILTVNLSPANILKQERSDSSRRERERVSVALKCWQQILLPAWGGSLINLHIILSLLRLMINIQIGHSFTTQHKESGWKVYMYMWIYIYIYKICMCVYTHTHTHIQSTWRYLHLLSTIFEGQSTTMLLFHHVHTLIPLVASIQVCIDSCIWNL